MFVLMTLGFAACNLPLLWKLPSAWHDRRDPALDGERDTDLWIWLFAAALSVGIGLRFFGHYYMQLVPPLALLAAGALARSGRRAVTATIVAASLSAVAFSAAGYFMHPFGPEPTYESVSRYVAANTHPDDKILVWGSEPEIYWASNRLPATRFLTTPTFLTGNHPGRPADEIDTDADTARNWEYFYEDFTADPPRYLLDTSPSKLRGATPDLELPQAHQDPHQAVPLRAHDRRRRHLSAQVAPTPGARASSGSRRRDTGNPLRAVRGRDTRSTRSPPR